MREVVERLAMIVITTPDFVIKCKRTANLKSELFGLIAEFIEPHGVV
jgi:hypothetical protein